MECIWKRWGNRAVASLHCLWSGLYLEVTHCSYLTGQRSLSSSLALACNRRNMVVRNFSVVNPCVSLQYCSLLLTNIAIGNISCLHWTKLCWPSIQTQQARIKSCQKDAPPCMWSCVFCSCTQLHKSGTPLVGGPCTVNVACGSVSVLMSIHPPLSPCCHIDWRKLGSGIIQLPLTPFFLLPLLGSSAKYS